MRVAHLGLVALVRTARKGNAEGQIAALQPENDALTGELAALTETVDQLATAAEQQQTDVIVLNDEIDALTGLELADLPADVAQLDASLDALDAEQQQLPCPLRRPGHRTGLKAAFELGVDR